MLMFDCKTKKINGLKKNLVFFKFPGNPGDSRFLGYPRIIPSYIPVVMTTMVMINVMPMMRIMMIVMMTMTMVVVVMMMIIILVMIMMR